MKAKLMFVVFVLFGFSASANAQGVCDPETYSKLIFYYPVYGQEGKPMALGKDTLANPVNFQTTDPRDQEILNLQMDSLLRSYGAGTKFNQLWIYRDEQGIICPVSDPPASPRAVSDSNLGLTATKAESKLALQPASRKNRTLGKVIRVIGQVVPFIPGVGFAVGVPASIGADEIADLIDKPRPVAASEAATKQKKPPKYDHDSSGSFANLWK